MRSLFVHFAAVGIGVSQHIARKFDGHALHAEADAECRHVVCAAVFGSDELSFDSSLAEARADDDSVHVFKLFFHVSFSQLLAVDEMDISLVVIVGCSLRQCFEDGFVCVLQVVFSYQSDFHHFRSAVPAV